MLRPCEGGIVAFGRICHLQLAYRALALGGAGATDTVGRVKVVVVTTWYPNAANPSMGTFVEKDVTAIRSVGHDVNVVHLVSPSLHDGGQEREVRNGISVHRIPMSTSNPMSIARAARAVRPLLGRANLVHTMAFSTLLPFALIRPSLPWVHTEHWSGLTTPTTLPTAWQVVLPVLKRLFRRPDVVTAVCEYLAQPIRAVRSGPVVVVPCIVPPVSLVPRSVRDGVVRLVAIGALVDRKDPLVAVDTLTELRSRGVDASLTWVGDGPLRAEAEARAAAAGLAFHVSITGILDAAGVRAALGASDLFFLPTKADNFCVSAAEALVSGRPVVVGATGGQREYISPGVGALVGVQDARLYADAIEDVAARTASLTAEEIAATIGGRFDAPAVAEGYDTAYALAREVRATRRG
ncbi:glycosyltransferase involved in cell wall biosynthesis [Xylanimonas ulmi]|uniref:D-inositol 3-phosphate glycosyltransferase n=1 Tax=Xylanimonas ulmi TaxID=228973 RepID=A0A4Q7LYY1_9MICO|nr:glycosyltransferase involved in cell wall biosynthesis [Xylanibacterium ulmi]